MLYTGKDTVVHSNVARARRGRSSGRVPSRRNSTAGRRLGPIGYRRLGRRPRPIKKVTNKNATWYLTNSVIYCDFFLVSTLSVECG